MVAQWIRSLDLRAHTSLSPIRREFAPSFVNYKKVHVIGLYDLLGYPTTLLIEPPGPLLHLWYLQAFLKAAKMARVAQLMQANHQYGVGSHPALEITKRVHRLAAANDKVYQLLTHCRGFSPGTPTSSTTRKT
jgi:hypothetical protein